jgi:hypothetical protein
MTNVTDFDITTADNASNVSDIITKQKDGTASQCEKQLPYLILCLPNTEIIHQHGVSETPNKMKIDCYFFFSFCSSPISLFTSFNPIPKLCRIQPFHLYYITQN